MFGIKKKPVVSEELRTEAAQLKKLMAEAEVTEDIGEKLVRMDNVVKAADKIRSEIFTCVLERDFSMRDVAAQTLGTGATLVSSTVLSTIGIKTGLVALALAPSALILVPAMAIGGLAGAGVWKFGAWAHKKMTGKYEANFKEISEMADSVSKAAEAQRDALLARTLPDFKDSPVFDEIYERFPSLKEKFLKEAVRQGRMPELLVPAPKKNAFVP